MQRTSKDNTKVPGGHEILVTVDPYPIKSTTKMSYGSPTDRREARPIKMNHECTKSEVVLPRQFMNEL